MDKRFPFDSSAGQARQQQARVQAAIEMEEALFLQRRQELRRDLQLQRLLLQEQLDQQNALGAPASTASGLGSRSIYELPYGAAGLAAQYEQELLLQQEHIRRRQLVQAAMNAERDAATEAIADAVRRRTSSNADLGASAALTAQKRSFDQQEAESPPRKRPAKSEVGAGKHSSSPEKETSKSGSSASKSKASEKPAKSKSRVKRKSSVSKPKPSKRRNSSSKTPTPLLSRADSEESGDKMRDALEALAAVGSDLPPQPIQSEIVFAKGTIENLLAAAKTEEKADAVVETIAKLKSSVVWEESEDEQDEAETVEIRGFQSSLPRLPREPEYRFKFNGKSNKSNGMKSVCASPSANKDKSKDSRSVLSMTVDYPYPVDTWWPSVSSVRKERRNKGEESDEEDVTEAVIVDGKETLYRANLSSVRKRLANAVEPGVLEKLPHCRVHRMFMKHKRVANVPDHAFCWQVSENYCNHPLVCCSVCSTWRHAACGGHHKPFTVKDMTEQPFVAICDRCHVEKDILKDYPKAQERLERQRVEHIRRGLATSAVIRQAAFAKHGGTYKWPLGSVSTTHIGGHIRSVHSRHDKAEKQWSEMVTRLSKGYASRPKERAKVRTRELERLLAHVEDAEGVTDRHNMMLFLQRDVARQHPVGYEIRTKNIFDPNESEFPPPSGLKAAPLDEKSSDDVDESGDIIVGRKIGSRKSVTGATTSVCARRGCTNLPRFDSEFCSDACGVSAMEFDLLKSFQLASEVHPSMLR